MTADRKIAQNRFTLLQVLSYYPSQPLGLHGKARETPIDRLGLTFGDYNAILLRKGWRHICLDHNGPQNAS